MRNIMLAGTAAVAAIAVAWSISTFVTPKIVSKVEATETSATISPSEIMVRQGSLIPVEYWADPF
jgi:hypothetical protein